ncbi:MAG TPA: GNAT family N-acetyltransferase [Myxococcales bacterium]|nr:GNAT family N-acetyltransferase [Myxococcales bacterium]HIL01871.1 GNAT family N-acetyltransferase [Myxococcales bacterium]
MADLEMAEGVASLPADEWNALVGDESPFLEWDWLASLEKAGAVGGKTGWGSRPLVARENGRLVAACPLYLKLHSEGEFVFDWGWADASQRAGIPYYPKILVGVPFTPVTGARFLAAPGQDRGHWIALLGEALRDTCIANEISGVHVNFCQDEELDALEKLDFQVRFGLQYHWLNDGYGCFEDYLARFRSKRRNQIRRERRELEHQGVVIETHVGSDIPDDLFSPMYEFYKTTVQEHFYGRQYLNFPLFELLRDHFRERLVFIVARQGEQLIGGTFNVAKGDVLYGRYWGATRSLRYLHFNVCYYAAIEHCINAGLGRFEPGAGGNYKQLRGFDPQPTRSAHFLREPRLADAVGQFLRAERDEVSETIGWYMERSALKKKEPDPGS